MNIVRAGYEIFSPVTSGEENIKKIEKVARVCYKSEDKICDGSAERMVRALVRSKHYAMLEHGSVIVEAVGLGAYEIRNIMEYFVTECGEICELRFTDYQYSHRRLYSGNLRAWREFFELCYKYSVCLHGAIFEIFKEYEDTIFSGLDFSEIAYNNPNYFVGMYTEVKQTELSDEEMLVHYDLTVKFTCDRGVSHEIVRHRKASFAQESTRYCNYSNGEISFIDPEPAMEAVQPMRWRSIMRACEDVYGELIDLGATPQEARSVLPNSLKTEVVMTAKLREWIHFFELRALGRTGKPHPQMVEVAMPLLIDLKGNDLYREILKNCK